MGVMYCDCNHYTTSDMQGIIWGEPDLAVTMQSWTWSLCCLACTHWSLYKYLFPGIGLTSPLAIHCKQWKSVVSVSVILESYLVEFETDSIHRTQMQWPATPTPRRMLIHRQAPPLSGHYIYNLCTDGLFLSLVFFEVSSLLLGWCRGVMLVV